MIFEKILSFFTAVIVAAVGFGVRLFLPVPPAAKTEAELESVASPIDKKTVSDTIYAVSLSQFSQAERDVLISLQGIVAKTDPCIYLLYGWPYNTYLDELEASGKTVVRSDDNGDPWTLAALIEKFRDHIADGGYVLYRDSEYAEGLNVATNFATVFGYLPVPESLAGTAGELGLTLKKDISREEYNYKFQKKYWKELKDSFNTAAVVHECDRMRGMRDLAIEQGYFCFWTQSESAGTAFLKKVLSWAGKNTSVFGWVDSEKEDVAVISRMGCSLNPTDYCYNNSILSSVSAGQTGEEKRGTVHSDPSKHYVCLLFTDGDNCQWLQNGFGEYFDTVRRYPDIPVSWTLSPMLKDLCPLMYDRITVAANENTSFTSGPSGIGYANPKIYDVSALDGFSTQTAAAMLRSRERVLCILDDYSEILRPKMAYSFDYFSRFGNIDGALLYLDPDRYEGGKGRVWFSNDKPFVSVRMSLWNYDGYDGVTDEWLREKADEVNGYAVDNGSIEGYSLIAVQAWTMKPDSIAKFVGMLDEHVEILCAEDFIASIGANIPHEYAKP